MSVALNVGDAIRVRMYSYSPSLTQVGVNTIYMLCTNTTGGGVNDTDFLAAWDTAVASLYKPTQSANTRYSATGVAVMNTGLATALTSERRTIASRGPGGAIGNAAPNQVSAVISFRTNFASKHDNGRIFPPFPPTLFFDATGAINAGGLVLYQTLATAILAPFTVTVGVKTATFTLQIRGIKKQARPLPDLATYTAVATSIAKSGTGTQRRRSQFGRANSEPTAN